MYTCGNKQCRGVVSSSFYSFQIFEMGTYQVHLIRNKEEEPYAAYASTVVLEVVDTPLDCPGAVNAEALEQVNNEAVGQTPALGGSP